MSQNDRVLIDMTTTNGIHVRAMMGAISDHDIELQPFIDTEIKNRQAEMEEMIKKEEVMSRASSVIQQAEDQEGDLEPPDPLLAPRDEEEAPLIFRGTPDVED
jgi:hypothetical protein